MNPAWSPQDILLLWQLNPGAALMVVPGSAPDKRTVMYVTGSKTRH